MLRRRFGLALPLVLALTATPASAATSSTLELILDASGSMNAALPGGTTRIAAARAAVATIAGKLPADLRIALRAYGHQSPREKHDCDDTQLLVPFGRLADVRSGIVRAAEGVRAQGYTPITRVLGLAAKDLAAAGPGEHVIVLVSDGKETCDGDPCATAQALRQADAKLVVHTIGFNVDSAARAQLQCIAAAAGGTYHDAAGADDLAAALAEAAVAVGQPIAPRSSQPGNLTIEHADLAGHRVIDAKTGKEAGTISSLASTIRVPPGVYSVSFGKAMWKSVVVEPGGRTVLKPAILEVHGASIQGHKVLDSETGAEVAEVSAVKNRVTLIPGVYDVTFGGAVWPLLKLDGGAVTTLKPGRIHVRNAGPNGIAVHDAAGKEVGRATALQSTLPLPPGDYSVEIHGHRQSVTLAEGALVELDGH